MSGERAYARHLERCQAAQSPEEIQEGFAVWFDGALPAGRGRALDYGAGKGQGVAYLRQRGFAEVEAYEPDPVLAEALQPAASVHADADPAAFLARREGAYDVILAKDVLEHVPTERTVAVVAQLRAALRPGGRLVVSVPHAVSFIGQTLRYADWTHTTVFTAESLRYVLEAGGFPEVDLVAPRFRFKPRPATIAYRLLRRAWHGALAAIYYLENPSREQLPPHFFPRLVAAADRPTGS